MHMVLGAGAVDGLYVAGDPTTGQRPTQLDKRDFNTLILELANLVQTAGFALNSADDTQVTQAILRLAAGRQTLRNYLVNGDFRLWQRGIHGFTADAGVNIYGPDRWFVNNNNGPIPLLPFAVNISSIYAGGATVGPFAQTFIPRFGAGNYPAEVMSFGQRIEDVRTLSGQTATLSFWARCSSDGFAVATETDLQPVLRQHHGTGGSPASDVTTPGPVFRVTSTWQRFTWTVDVPTVGAIGTDGWPLAGFPGTPAHSEVKSYLELRFDMTNWNGTLPTSVSLNIAQVQLESGLVASDFEQRPLTLELSLARRYYEKSIGFAQSPSQTTWPCYEGAANALHSGTLASGLNTRFRVTKARIPTVRFRNPENGDVGSGFGRIIWNSVQKDVNTLLYTSVETTGIPQVTGSSTSSPVYGHWEADAEL